MMDSGDKGKMVSLKKYLFLCLGLVSLLLGMIGIFLPVLPTTPFLLLAAFCFLRSSKKMYDWLMGHKVFGAYIQSYLIHKAITRKTKICALFFLWSTMGISILLLESLHLRVFLGLIGVGVTVHLVILKTMSEEQMQKVRMQEE